MSSPNQVSATLERMQRAVDERWASVVVSPPPFEAILARAQGRPPTPPSGPPLPLPSGALGPSSNVVSAGPATTVGPAPSGPATAGPAVSVGTATTAGPATVAGLAPAATAGSPGATAGSAAATVGRGGRRVGRRLVALVAAGAVVGVAALGVVILMSDEPCGPNAALAAEGPNAACLSLPDAAEALLTSLRAADESSARQYVVDACWDRIPDGIRALADGADVSITGSSTARGVGVVFLDVGPVPVAPVPFTFVDGRWRLQFCPALSLLGG